MGRKDLRIPIWPHLYYGSSLVLSYDTQGHYCGQKNKRRTSRWQNGFQEPTYHFLPILASGFWEIHKLPIWKTISIQLSIYYYNCYISSDVLILLLSFVTHQFPFNQIRWKMNRECWIWKNEKSISRNWYMCKNKLIHPSTNRHVILNTFSRLSIIRCRDQYIATSIWKCKNAGVWDVWVYYGILVCHTIHMETYNLLQKYFALVVILISF